MGNLCGCGTVCVLVALAWMLSDGDQTVSVLYSHKSVGIGLTVVCTHRTALAVAVPVP